MVENSNHSLSQERNNEVLLKVKSASSAASLAAAIANNVYANMDITLRAIGAAAVNQSVKAMAIASSYVGPRGYVLSFRPGFATVMMDDGEISAMTFKVIVS